MDHNTTIECLKKLVKDFCVIRNWGQYHNPKDLAIGISTEANELLDKFRFKSDEDMKKMMKDSSKRQEIENEVADVLFFLLRFSEMNDIDLNSALINKLELNNKKYPANLSKGKNKKYNEL